VVLFGVAFKSQGGYLFRTHSMEAFFTSTTSSVPVPMCYISHPIDSRTAAMRIELPIKMHNFIGTYHIVRWERLHEVLSLALDLFLELIVPFYRLFMTAAAIGERKSCAVKVGEENGYYHLFGDLRGSAEYLALRWWV